jgi:DNA-directed RNA polymerase subunit RPC12/RpoP
MVTVDDASYCGACGAELGEPRETPPELRDPCPSCGSRARLVKVHVEEHLELHSDLSLRQKRPGFKSGKRPRPVQEQWVGEVLSADGVWRRRERVVDRERGIYRERILDPDGTVVHEDEGPLAGHTGHGSDKAADY